MNSAHVVFRTALLDFSLTRVNFTEKNPLFYYWCALGTYYLPSSIFNGTWFVLWLGFPLINFNLCLATSNLMIVECLRFEGTTWIKLLPQWLKIALKSLIFIIFAFMNWVNPQLSLPFKSIHLHITRHLSAKTTTKRMRLLSISKHCVFGSLSWSFFKLSLKHVQWVLHEFQMGYCGNNHFRK